MDTTTLILLLFGIIGVVVTLTICAMVLIWWVKSNDRSSQNRKAAQARYELQKDATQDGIRLVQDIGKLYKSGAMKTMTQEQWGKLIEELPDRYPTLAEGSVKWVQKKISETTKEASTE